MASNQPPFSTHSQALPDQHISQQQTRQHPAVAGAQAPIPLMPAEATPPPQPSIKRRLQIIIPVVIVLLLVLGIYFVWNVSTAPSSISSNPGITQQNFGNNPASTNSNRAATASLDGGTIQVYIVGAVKLWILELQKSRCSGILEQINEKHLGSAFAMEWIDWIVRVDLLAR